MGRSDEQGEPMRPRTYYVYILANAWNTVFYIGMTNDLARRMQEHKERLADGFTDRYNVVKLVYVETHTDVHEAIVREKRLKRWRRAWKEALIREGNPDFADLWTEDSQPL